MAHVGQELGLVSVRLLQHAALLGYVSVEARVLDGDGGLAGEGGKQGDVPLAEGAGRFPDDHYGPDDPAIALHGNRKDGPIALPCQDIPEGVVRFGQDVGDLDGLARGRAPARGPLAQGHLGDLEGPDECLAGIPTGAGAELPGRLEILIDESGVRLAQLARLLCDRAQHLSQVQGRADGAADLAHDAHFLQGEFERAGPGLELLEQADILDGDDGLVGEGVEKGDLLVREEASLGPANQDHSDRNAFPQQWCTECGPVAEPFGQFHTFGEVGRFRQVLNMDCLSVHEGSASHRRTIDGYPHGYERIDRSMMGYQLKRITINEKD